MLENIIGVEEAAKILNLSPGTVKNMCAAGKLEAKKIGRTWVLNKINLEGSYMFEKLNQFNSTIITWEGKELRTTQDPFIDGYKSYIDAPDEDAYRAHAIDKDGNEYMIYWEILNDSDDESDRCDWDSPIEVKEI